MAVFFSVFGKPNQIGDQYLNAIRWCGIREHNKRSNSRIFRVSYFSRAENIWNIHNILANREIVVEQNWTAVIFRIPEHHLCEWFRFPICQVNLWNERNVIKSVIVDCVCVCVRICFPAGNHEHPRRRCAAITIASYVNSNNGALLFKT